MDSEHGSGSSKHSRTRPATDNEGDPLAPAKKLGSSSSASSFSSDSSSEDLFQVVTKEVTKSSTGPIASPKPDEDAQPALKDDENNVSSNTSSKSEETDNESPGPTSSQVSDVTHESVLHSMSPTQSPPIQVMERPGDYDPFRIPSSVFARSKSTTPMEWSVASNESLFSIHVGNNSFSRDHIFMLGGDFRKSGELTKSGELIMFSPPPPAAAGESIRKSVDMGKNTEATGVADETMKDSTRATADDQSEEKIPPPGASWNSSSFSRRSDGSGTSTRSFAFPIKKKCAWPSCYCSNCSRAFCYCTWPSCYCTWPRCYCSTCSWAFCYCWNCSRKRFCCFSSTILTDGVRTGSVKVEPEKQDSLSPPPKKTSNAAACRWFPCFSFCPYCRCC